MFVGPRPAVATKARESGLQKVSCCSGDSSCGHAIVFQISRKCMERGPSRFSWLPVGILRLYFRKPSTVSDLTDPHRMRSMCLDVYRTILKLRGPTWALRFLIGKKHLIRFNMTNLLSLCTDWVSIRTTQMSSPIVIEPPSSLLKIFWMFWQEGSILWDSPRLPTITFSICSCHDLYWLRHTTSCFCACHKQPNPRGGVRHGVLRWWHCPLLP